MMKYIKTYSEDTITWIEISRESALNALNSELLVELDEAICSIDLTETRCVVFCSSGEKAFVAGADISEMVCLAPEEAKSYSTFGNDVFLKIEKCPLPTIAVIQGYALGGGCELAIACDLRICSDNAVFGQPEVGLGIIPGFGGTQRLSRIIGVGRAKELIFKGVPISADLAFRYGLVNAVCSRESLREEAKLLAGKIASNAPMAVQYAKRAIEEGCQLPIEEAVRLESELFSLVFRTEDHKEGLSAFMEKRKHIPYKGK